jgi:hypothetical protein
MLNLRNESELNGATVGQIAEELYRGVTYDTALPQTWVDTMQNRGFDPRGVVVWGYPEGNTLYGQPLPLTVEAALMLANLAGRIS